MNHSEFLQDFIDTYVADPTKRAVDTNGKSCQYLTSDGRKCAIGRHILPGTYNIRCENKPIYAVLETMPEMLPDWMKKLNRGFLEKIQFLHDSECVWINDGLTPFGSCCLDNLKKLAKELDEES